VAILRPEFPHRITPNYSGWKVLVRNIVCYLSLILALHSAVGQEVKAPEYQVKAAFLFNFTKLVDWPTNTSASNNESFVIGVLGKDPFGKALDDVMTGRTVNGRNIQVTRFGSVEEIGRCHMLFICESERRKLESILDALQDKPVLTVSDIKGFGSRGMIELVKSNDTINLRINLKAANHTGLQLSSRLTRLDKSLQPAGVNSPDSPSATHK
jgi:hypothetical protein